MTGDCHVRIRGSRGLRCPRPPDLSEKKRSRSYCRPGQRVHAAGLARTMSGALGLRHWVSTPWREVVNARIVRWAVRLPSDVVGYLRGIRTEVCWWTGIVAGHGLAAHGL